MRYVPRLLAEQVVKASRSFPAIVLTGPRRAGKTMLLTHAFPHAGYHLFEDRRHLCTEFDERFCGPQTHQPIRIG